MEALGYVITLQYYEQSEKGLKPETISFRPPDSTEVVKIVRMVESRMNRKLQPQDKLVISGLY